MRHSMDRSVHIFCFVAVSLVCVTLAGCQGEASGEYETYSQLEEAARGRDDMVADVTSDVAESTEPNPSPTSPTGDGATATDDEEPTELADSSAVPVESATETPVTDDTPTRDGDPDSQPEQPAAELVGETEASFPPDLPADEPVPTELTETPAELHEIKLLVPEQTFHEEGPEGALRVSYDDLNLLTVLNMEPVPPNPEVHFPDWLAGLAGQRIRLRGFMYPAFLSTGLRSFVLVRDNQECCFGPGAKIYDHIQVFMRDGVTSDYIQGRPFDVTGVFRILPEADEDELYQLYLIEDAIVIEK